MATVSNQWVPEDDLLLKNACETGASLEALAKGAIRFSRRYTLRELRERWHSLLYDPDISSQASARIFELEISGFNPSSKLNKDVPKKRKHEKMRKSYYAMRKKFRSEFFNDSDLSFFVPNSHEFNAGVDNPLGQDCMIGDGISDPLGLQEEDLDILRHAFPGPIRDASLRKGSMGEIRKQLDSPSSDGFSSFQDFADPDSLLNLSNEDEILLVEVVDEKHVEDNKSCLVDNTDSVNQEPDKVEVVETVALPEAGPKVEVPIELTSGPVLPELCHGNIICTLNTEDTEIPCNDDIFLLIHPSTSFVSSPTQPSPSVYMNACGPSYEKDYNDGQVLGKGNDSTKAFPGPQKVGTHGKTDIPGFVNKSIRNSGKGKSQYVVPKPCSKSLTEKGVDKKKVGDSSTTIIRSMKEGSACIPPPETSVDCSASEHEESSQNDNDVPYFSDIEAMILEMDLDPCDEDTQSSKQVPSYQYDDTKRAIIRLEQAARSCLQRIMASQGALAMLYGRHMMHYIKKPEVILGRSTDDVDVDIDLRKEGQANKISRRQAIIKMEADGSFFLKNLGKSSISVNGILVATGQLLTLSSSCLIEIKGMSFVFEIKQ